MIDTEEIWKPIFIDGEETPYVVSNKGRVMNNKNKFILKQHEKIKKHTTKPDDFYLTVTLYYKKKKKAVIFSVHRLVAYYFIPNPDNLPVVNHKDGDKTNNNVSNLEWCTYSENTLHAFRNNLIRLPIGEANSFHKLTDETVHAICKDLCNGLGQTEIGKKYGVSKCTIGDIKARRHWTHISSQYDFEGPKQQAKGLDVYYDEIDDMLCGGLKSREIMKRLKIPNITEQQYFNLIYSRKHLLRTNGTIK